MNFAPLSSCDMSEIVPFIFSVRVLTIDKPRPVEFSPPVGTALRRLNFVNNFVLSSSVKPGPSS